jgi:hypothetical protein
MRTSLVSQAALLAAYEPRPTVIDWTPPLDTFTGCDNPWMLTDPVDEIVAMVEAIPVFGSPWIMTPREYEWLVRHYGAYVRPA